MRRAVLVVIVALGSAVGCSDNPVSPSAVPGRADAFRNRLVSRPDVDKTCIVPWCGCAAPCDQGRSPAHRRSSRSVGDRRR
jgi:hypothetical protein